ncbi:MAG: hypothetical protein QOI54_3638 [Actinomycetota bacterium]|nr:hypothetical protein [Actinomycetota bacterium]
MSHCAVAETSARHAAWPTHRHRPPCHTLVLVSKRRPEANRTGPVLVRRPDAATWNQALKLAAGEHRRLELQPDGSVIVHNQPIR